MDGALRQLGYAPLTPRRLRRVTLDCADASGAENLYHQWQEAATNKTQVDWTPDSAAFFQELMTLSVVCPGCGGMVGDDHAPGCPYDYEEDVTDLLGGV